LRLLLDEHYSNEIAVQLRDREHDVVAVTERSDLVGLRDEQLFRAMSTEGRAIVTENWPHFSRLVAQAVQEHVDHYGVVFTSARQLPRGKNTIGLFVQVLDGLLRVHTADDALLNSSRWLP